MVVERKHREAQPWFRRLYLPSYQVTEAARYANSKPGTVSSWLYRGESVLPGHQRGKLLSYLELVEVAFVAFFRNMGVKMYRIREARQYIAQNFTAEYPFAEYKFKTEGMYVLMEFQQFAPDAHFDKVIVADAHGQLAWESLLGDKFAEFDYEYEMALRWHPAGRDSNVVIDPRISFGAPVAEGLPTWVMRGRYRAGESVNEISKEFNITEGAVIDGLEFEGIAA
ncbi:MAG: DUF433 domain-containing protein [Chloroflexi bacterium]|nr:DUF433 domain-containing protein [Chloroflexota bacterium]